ncbi:MAG: aminotransferase class V-fold PLP-dependent enzyme [Candidatus Paceibacterota bacterium]|jgi:cysteine desulfurase
MFNKRTLLRFASAGRTYLDCASGINGNPSSPHTEGRRAKLILEDARVTIARLVEVQPDDVIFTSGATEANALAILGNLGLTKSPISGPVMSGLRKSKIHMLYLPSAHASVVENMKLLSERGVEIEALPIRDGCVDCEKLKELLRPETKLVSMDAVCGETGVIWNTREVAETLKRTHNGGSNFLAPSGLIGMSQPVAEETTSSSVLHVDASQAPLTEKITRAHFGADLLTLDGSKVGARGIGTLIAHRTIPISPLYLGGGQERGLRPGTEVPELAEKFAACLRQAALSREAFLAAAKRDRAELIKKISSIQHMCINEGSNQSPNILNISLIGRDTDYLVALLDEAGFAVSTRSACETDSQTGSRAVFAITGDQDRARATLRISWGPSTRSRELVHFAKALVQAVAFIDSSDQR